MAESALSPKSPATLPTQPLNLLQWIALYSRATGISLIVLLHTLKILAIPQKNGQTPYQQIAYNGMRIYQTGLSATSIQNLRPSTTITCKKFAKMNQLRYETMKLEDGATASWIGNEDARKVVVLFHGGGYMGSALPQHIELGFGFVKKRKKKKMVLGRERALVVLGYSLASEERGGYPLQLRQAVALMRCLLHERKVLAKDVNLIGDSAGGHLLLSLLIHMVNPNPRVPELKIDGTFSGAVLISPWVKLDTAAASMEENKEKDVLTISGLEYWAGNFLNGQEVDIWNTPLSAPENMWGEVPVDAMLVLYGEDELLRDDIEVFCGKLKAHYDKATIRKCENEVHVHMIMNRFLKINKPCESEKVLLEWMGERLGSP